MRLMPTEFDSHVSMLKQPKNQDKVATMSEADDKKIVVKSPYTTPKLVDYGSVTELTEAKSPGATDGTSTNHHGA
jgi:hypothetical protein